MKKIGRAPGIEKTNEGRHHDRDNHDCYGHYADVGRVFLRFLIGKSRNQASR